MGAGVRAALQPPHLCRDCFPAAAERRVAAVLRAADAPLQHQRGDHPPQEQQVRPQTQLRDECVGPLATDVCFVLRNCLCSSENCLCCGTVCVTDQFVFFLKQFVLWNNLCYGTVCVTDQFVLQKQFVFFRKLFVLRNSLCCRTICVAEQFVLRNNLCYRSICVTETVCVL